MSLTYTMGPVSPRKVNEFASMLELLLVYQLGVFKTKTQIMEECWILLVQSVPANSEILMNSFAVLNGL